MNIMAFTNNIPTKMAIGAIVLMSFAALTSTARTVQKIYQAWREGSKIEETGRNRITQLHNGNKLLIRREALRDIQKQLTTVTCLKYSMLVTTAISIVASSVLVFYLGHALLRNR